MAGNQVKCPECWAILRTTSRFQPGKAIKCPSCGVTFHANTGPKGIATRPVARPRRRLAEDSHPDIAPPRPRGTSTLLIGGLLAGGAGLFLLVVGGFALWWGLRSTAPDSPGPPPPMPQVSLARNERPKPPPGFRVVRPRVPAQDDPLPPEVPPRVPEPDLRAPPDLPPSPGATPAPDARPRLVLDARGHTAPVPTALFTPDAREVITVSADKTVRVWDVETGETVRIFRVPIGDDVEGSVSGAALSPDGQTLAVGGHSLKPGKYGILIYLIDWKTGQIEKVLKGNRDPISYLAFSPDGRLLASATPGETALVLDVDKGTSVAALRGHRARIRHVCFSPDGRQVATASVDKTVRVWDAATGRELAVLRDHRHQCNCSAWSPDGKTLATGCVDGEIRLWDTASWDVRRRFPSEKKNPVIQIISLAYTPDGKRLLYTGIGATGRAGLLDVNTGERLRFTRHNNTVRHGQLSRDGKLAVTTGGNDHETYVWKTADASEVCRLQGDGRSVWGVGWLPNSKTIAWGNVNRGDTRLAATPLEHTFDLSRLEPGKAPEGKVFRAIFGAGGYTFRVLDHFRIAIQRDGRVVHVFRSPYEGDRIYCCTFLHGPYAVMGGSFGLYLVDLQRKRTIRSFQGHTGLILGVAPSPDGRYFLTGSSDQTIRLWDPNQKEPLLSLFVAGNDWIAWTPQGYYACSAYGERLMGWQINNGPERLGSFHPAVRFRKSLYAPKAWPGPWRRLAGTSSAA
jgi:WD40 repeat protein/ribosomal protein S27E